MRNFEVLILAAGNGTRMKSKTPKLLNKIGKHTILDKSIRLALSLDSKKVNVIINKDYQIFINKYKNVKFFHQNKILGTGHAVKSFYKNNKTIKNNLLIMMGDAPSIKKNSIRKVLSKLKKIPIVILGACIKKNKMHGMIEIKNDKIKQIKEYSFLKQKEKNNCICNTGIMGIQKKFLYLINKIKKNKFKKEYLLTDIMSISSKKKIKTSLVLANEGPLSFGINTIKELKLHN
jgi:bifunctional UDP-N-acetylglucosamine pyrophosphorylase / glucosamine-1-phosphate N-acetyltransferase